MKRCAFLLLAIFVFLSCLSLSGNAALSNDTHVVSTSLTDQEIFVLQEKLSAYGYGEENFIFDILYDADNFPSFMFGATKEGYIVLRRGTYKFFECGEGNPYRDYMSEKKYYAGTVCYFVQTSGEESKSTEHAEEYYDILRGSYSSFVPKATSNRLETEPQKTYDTSSTTSVHSSVVLSDNYNYIRTRAFGDNRDNTCSAVATGIALNYIALRHNMAIISNNHISEKLSNGIPAYSGQISTLYPNANRLHRYLVETCRMAPASYADDVSQPVSRYISNNSSYYYGYNFFLHWTLFPNASTIKENIQNDRPVLITTTLFAQYDFHTMCVYGYRDTSDGAQLLVHVGWYTSNQMQEESAGSNQYYQKTTWIDANDATYGYYFSFDNPLANFTDIPVFTSWAYPGIVYTVNNGLMNGTSATTFSPNSTMSRAMLVSTLYRMAGSPPVTYTDTFSDVPSNTYYSNGVIWATNNGIVNGIGDGKFNPHGNVTREQIAVFLYRYATYYGYDTSKHADLSTYPDAGNISDYAKSAMSWAVAEQIINGISSVNGPTVLSPRSSATRAQTAAFLKRFIENITS